MANVGKFAVRLEADVKPFAAGMEQAAVAADRSAASSTMAAAATNAQATAAVRAGAAMGQYAATTGVAALATGPLAKFAAKLSVPLDKLNALLDSGGKMLSKAKDELVGVAGQFGEFLRTAGMGNKQLESLGDALRSFGAQADMSAGKIGWLGYSVRHTRRELTKFEQGLLNHKKHGPILRGLAQAAIAVDIGFARLSKSITTSAASVFRFAGASREWLQKSGGGMREWLFRFRAQLGDLGKYVSGSVGPALSDFGKIFSKGIGPAVKAAGASISGSLSRAAQPILTLRNLAAGLSDRLQAFAATYRKIGDGLSIFRGAVLGVVGVAERLGKGLERFAFQGKNSVAVVGGLGQMFGRASAAMQKWLKNHPAIAKFLGGMAKGVADAGLALLSLGTIAGAGPSRKVVAWFKQTWAGAKELAQILGPVGAGFKWLAAGAVAGLGNVAKAAAYVGKEVLMGVATVARMGGALVALGGHAVRAVGYVGTLTAKVGVMGLGFIKAAGSFAPMIVRLGLLGLAATGVGGAFVPLLLKFHTAATALPLIGKAASAVGHVFGGLAKMVAKAVGKLALLSSVGMAGVLGAVAGLALLTKSQFKAGAEAAALSAKIGIQTESLIGLQHAAKQSGVKNLDQHISGLNQKLQGADPDSPLAQGIARAGLSIEDLKRKAPDQALADVADAMQGMESHAERVRLATHLFGEEGHAMARMLADGSAGLEAAAADADKLGLSISRVDAAMIEQANAAVGRLKDLFLGIGRQVAIRVAPFVEALAAKFVDVGTSGGSVGELVDKAFRVAGDAVSWVLDAVDASIVLWLGAKSAVAAFGAAAADGLASFLGGANWLAGWIDSTIVGFGKLRIGVVKMFAGIFDGIGKLAALLPSLPEWLGGGKLINPETFHGIGQMFRDTADLLQDELDRRERFTFDGAVDGLRRASGSLRKTAEQANKDMAARLDGRGLAERFRDFTSGIADDARKRAEATAKQVSEGSAGILDAAADAAADKQRKLQDALFAEMTAGEALLKGSAEAFSVALGAANLKQDMESAAKATTSGRVAAGQAGAGGAFHAQTAASGDDQGKLAALLRRLVDIAERRDRERRQGEPFDVVPGTI